MGTAYFLFGERYFSGKEVIALKQNTVVTGKKAYDPMGSYTGIPQNPLERPIQDADDL